MMDGYRGLSEGQRVSFVWRGSPAAHGRRAAEEMRVIGERQPQREHADDPDSGAGAW